MNLPDTLAALTAVGPAVAGGVYFAFSGMVMPALSRMSAAAATEAMQQINVAAVRPPFMGVFLGTSVVAVGTVVTRFRELPAGSAVWQVVGAGLYLGSVVITVAHHVPRNNRLAAAGAGYWPQFLRQWVPMNTVRGLAAGLGSAALVFGRQVGTL